MALGLGSSGQRTGSFYNLNIRVIPGDDLEPENRTEAHDRCSVHVGSNTHGCVNRDQTCLNITEPRGMLTDKFWRSLIFTIIIYFDNN